MFGNYSTNNQNFVTKPLENPNFAFSSIRELKSSRTLNSKRNYRGKGWIRKTLKSSK